MYNKSFLLLTALLLVCFSVSVSQQSILRKNERVNNEEEFRFTGNAKVDLFANTHTTVKETTPTEITTGAHGKKSPWLAAGLSFLVPGAGEYYADQYVRGGVFFAAEVVGITFGLVYNNKADKQTTFFQNYADNHYSVVKYVEWIYENIGGWGVSSYPTEGEVLTSNNTSLPPWQRVNWDKLNELERNIGSTFSHQLPRRPSQQYYELIGKYHEFRAGWDDYDSTFQYYHEPNGATYPISKRFEYYSEERGKANDYYTAAKRAVNLVILNHILSAIDAAWSASSFNAQFSSEIRLQQEQTAAGIDLYPTLNLKVVF